MTAKIVKFKVEKLEQTPSGLYAMYISKSGYKTLTGNFGFKVGDIVEMKDYDGYCPVEIKVNGKIIWTEKDKEKWWAEYNGEHKRVMRYWRQQSK